MRPRLLAILRTLPYRWFLLSAGGIFILYILWLGAYTYSDPIPDKLAREEANTKNLVVNDVTELNPVKVIDIIVPHSIEEIVEAVKANDHVSIGGGRNSMGGQTASERAVQIDMREYNRILDFSTSSKEITVQAGIRWREIQDYIDPHGLSVKIMQTYSNFTVGGSLSVNVHGRYIGLGPMILSVRSFKVVLADGTVVEASPTTHADIFYAAIGGMGGIGVISDVTLKLADNVNVERSRALLSTDEYSGYFRENVRDDPSVIFHNGDMYPPDFDRVSAVSWTITDKEPTTVDRLIPTKRDYWLERFAWEVISEWPGGRWLREHAIDPLLYRGNPPVHTRNYEASYDVAELEPENRENNTYVLQEYFVPVSRFDEWVPKMRSVFDDYDVSVINVSIRHALPDPGAKLAWAREEVFAFVVYYKQGTDREAQEDVGIWTRKMIDVVLSVGGTYYLPYQLHATDDQFHRAYPDAIEYFRIKNTYDPTNKFTNKLWDKYYGEEKALHFEARKVLLDVASTTREYFRPFDNAYLALPEWYIVYSAEEYANTLESGLPSHFAYIGANKDYWRQYEMALHLTATSTHDNAGYKTVLQVIGWSFTVENVLKGIYENTIGRVSEWLAGGVQVAEDRYAAMVAREYGEFLYDYPWYDFPYSTHLKGIWTLNNDHDHTWLQCLRRFERKIFLTLEYGGKAVYSTLIRWATHSKFGVQDDITYAIITRDGGKTTELIYAPHYHPFTRRLLDEFTKEEKNSSFRVLDISGNSNITFVYRDEVGASVPALAREVIRDGEMQHPVQGKYSLKDRITVEANVKDLIDIYRIMTERGLFIDHIYDY